MVVNFGEYFDDSNDELLILPFGSHSIDLDQYFYEMIVLSMPIKLIHPGIEDGTLKSEILNRLKEFDINKEKSVNFDPRWNKLNELKSKSWHIQREKHRKLEEIKRRTHYKASHSQIATDKTTGQDHLYHRAHWHEGKLYYRGKVLIDSVEETE